MPRSKAAAAKSNVDGRLRMLSLVVLVLQNVVMVLSIRYSKQQASEGGDDDAPAYITSTAVVLSEVLKLCMCTALVSYQEGLDHLHDEVVVKWRDGLALAVPALIYAVQNNILYFALTNLDAAVYQVLYQLKLLTTAVMSVLVLDKRLTRLKWASLCMLTAGVVGVQMFGTAEPSSSSSAADDADDADGLSSAERSATYGLIAVLTACMTSAFAGVYFEKILKGTTTSIWVRNIQLAFFGVIFSGLIGAAQDTGAIVDRGFLSGYTPLVWFIVTQQALGGLVVAMVVKYADNILKGFALSVSIVLTSLVAMRYQNFSPTFGFALGSALVLSATFVYNNAPAAKPEKPKPNSKSKSAAAVVVGIADV